jgi:hypothetical protein
VVQPDAAGRCDAIFRAAPLVAQTEAVVIGLPDTVWSPADALCELPCDRLSFLLFPVEHPEFFDAVVTDDYGNVLEIAVKQPGAASNWIWGAIKMPGSIFHALHRLWLSRSAAMNILEPSLTHGLHKADKPRASEPAITMSM